VSPAAAVTQLLEDALGRFRAEMEILGMTSTIAVKTDRLSGAVQASIEFHVSKALAERLASERV
jgi:hypothetical protein